MPLGAGQHDVLGALDEGEAGERLGLRARRTSGETEVILLERLIVGNVASFKSVWR